MSAFPFEAAVSAQHATAHSAEGQKTHGATGLKTGTATGRKTHRATSTSTPIGVSVTSPANLRQETSEFGRLPAVRIFYDGLPNSNAWTSGLPADADATTVISFNARPSTILSGADDAQLSHFFDTAPKTGHPIYYNFIHEPEVPIASGQFSAASYRAAFTHIIDIANAAHNPNLHSTTLLMAYDIRKSSHRNWLDYVPTGIQCLGWDAYPTGSAGSNLQHPQLTPPAQFLGPEIALAKSVGLPYGFGEFGLNTAHGRPGWLTSVGNYLLSSGSAFATLFNSPITTAGRTMKLTDAASIAAWRAIVARSEG
ncbi:MAG: hypothetical protein ABSA03_07555 [Streptosporangiaceae bacterium]